MESANETLQKHRFIKAQYLLLIWAAFSVILQLAFVRLFTTMNGALAYYGNIFLLVAMFCISAGFFSTRAARFVYMVPLLILASFGISIWLKEFNLIQQMLLEFQWSVSANMKPKDANLDLQLGAIIAFLSIIPSAYMTGSMQRQLLVSEDMKAQGYLLMALGGILGGLLFTLQNQLFSSLFSLFALVSILLFCGIWPVVETRAKGLFATAFLALLLICSFFVSSKHQWSPYQRIDVDYDNALITVFSNDFFIFASWLVPADSIPDNVRNDFAVGVRAIQPDDTVLVLGSGAGTRDVREALRAQASHVTAVEIDPIFVEIGRETDPDRTYDDPKVTVVIDDARHYLAETEDKFDVIYMNYLDSQTNTSNHARFRLDSFLYTIEGFRSVYEHLNEDGILVLNFATATPWLRRKMYETLQTAVDSPVRVFRYTDDRMQRFYAISKDRPVDFFPEGYVEVTSQLENSKLGVISTDDWPFFYSLTNRIPDEHMRLLVIVVLLLGCVFLYACGVDRDTQSNKTTALPTNLIIYSFFSGASFFFLELRSIAVLTPIFGSTYLAQALVISTVIGLSLIGSIVSLYLKKPPPFIAVWMCLFATMLLCYNADVLFHPYADAFFPSKSAFLLCLLLPIPVGGFLFMAYLKPLTSTSIASMQKWNLFGGILGGLMEAGVIIIGFKASLLFAMIFYAIAFFVQWVLPNAQQRKTIPA